MAGRRVVVVDPDGPEGPRILRDAGAKQILVVGGRMRSEAGIEARPRRGGILPLRDQSVDVVVAIECYGALEANLRDQVTREGSRVLREDGIFAAWTRQPRTALFAKDEGSWSAEDGSDNLDFYGLEEGVSAVFPHVRVLAQMPWQGFSLAPVPDDDDAELREPPLRLDEALLDEVPEASHYLALAGRRPLEAGLLEDCAMVPIPARFVFERGPSGEILDELEALREELSLRAARSVAAQNRARELEGQLDSLRTRNDSDAEAAMSQMRAALDAAQAEAAKATGQERRLRSEFDALEVERGRLEEELEETQRSNEELSREVERVQAVLEEFRANSGSRDRSEQNDLAILTRTVADQEKALARVADQLRESRRELEDGNKRERDLRTRLEALESERVELQRQLDVRVAEGDGARKLAARVEAELDVLRTRYAEQGDRLSAKVEEASRLSGEVEMLRARLAEQESHLQQTRSRAEALTASAAEGAEKGRMLAELAADRERLREELGHRSRQIESLEEKVWEGREALQRERLENVRLAGEVERLRELLSRGREIEKQRATEIENLGAELRKIELERVELKALLRAREERLSQLLSEADAQAGRGEDVSTLRGKLEARRGDLEALQAKLDKAEHLQQRSSELADQRGLELGKVKGQLQTLERRAEERGDLAARLQTELDVRVLEIEQTRTALQEASAELDARTQERDRVAGELKRRVADLERARSRESELSRRVFDLEASVERARKLGDAHSEAVLDLRRELESNAELDAERGEAVGPTPPGHESPEELRSRIRVLERELLRAREATSEAGPAGGAEEALRAKIRRLELENEIRASEQERMLLELDAAEQRIWEMTDTSDRNAARFAASLAQLEKQKERVDQLLDELEVTRSLLAAEQARTLEQERLLASERAKLARAGLGSEGFRTEAGDEDVVDEVFRELNSRGGNLVALGEQRRAPPPSTHLPMDDEFHAMLGDDGPVRPVPSPSKPPGGASSSGGPRVGPPPSSGSSARGEGGPKKRPGSVALPSRPSHVGDDEGREPPAESRRARVLIEEVDEEEWVNE